MQKMILNRRFVGLAVVTMTLAMNRGVLAQPGGFGGPPGGPPPGEMVRVTPVLAALDADQNGEISLAEIDAGAAALRKLDKNDDKKLSGDELAPSFGGRSEPGPQGRRGGPDERGPDERDRFGGPGGGGPGGGPGR